MKPCVYCGRPHTFDDCCESCWQVKGNFTDEHHLRFSPLACAVADEWITAVREWAWSSGWSKETVGAFNALELATRESPLRKVRP
jgi:hypothetical protein